MSSYLERLATGARNPSTRIAPLVRPLYLAPPIRPEPAGSSFERIDDEAQPATRRRADAPTTVRKSPRPVAGAVATPRSPASTGFEPLLPELRPADVLAPPTPAMPTAPGQDLEAQRTSDLRRASHSDAADVPPGRAQHRPENPRTSLVLGGQSVYAPTRGVGTAPTPPHTPPRALHTNQPERHGADEIQIHIGRVEVVALAQPPPPPARAERERRALRLDDYLRSGR
jgi:hypothetical protein